MPVVNQDKPLKKRRIWLPAMVRILQKKLRLPNKYFEKLSGIERHVISDAGKIGVPIPEELWPRLDELLDNIDATYAAAFLYRKRLSELNAARGRIPKKKRPKDNVQSE